MCSTIWLLNLPFQWLIFSWWETILKYSMYSYEGKKIHSSQWHMEKVKEGWFLEKHLFSINFHMNIIVVLQSQVYAVQYGQLWRGNSICSKNIFFCKLKNNATIVHYCTFITWKLIHFAIIVNESIM